MLQSICIHPSIFYTRLIRRSGHGGGWSLSQRSSGERRGTPWTGRQSITGPHTLSLTPKDNSESPVNLTCMFLDGGRKYPERTHAYTGRTCKLPTERTSRELNLEPSRCEATMLTPTPPCSPSINLQLMQIKPSLGRSSDF